MNAVEFSEPSEIITLSVLNEVSLHVFLVKMSVGFMLAAVNQEISQSRINNMFLYSHLSS
jgi:hypothetical protein